MMKPKLKELKLGQMKKTDPEYKKLSKELRNIVNDVTIINNWDKETAIQWLKLNNIAFKGKKPIELYTEGRGAEVSLYVSSRIMQGKKV